MLKMDVTSQMSDLGISSEDKTGLQENIAAVRGDVRTHAQNVFIEFLLKHPENSGVFPDYVAKTGAELKAQDKFNSHTKKVLDMLLDIVENSDDAGKLKNNASRLVNMSQHVSLNTAQFEALFDVLIPYLEDALGDDCAAALWRKAGVALVAQMRAAGMS